MIYKKFTKQTDGTRQRHIVLDNGDMYLVTIPDNKWSIHISKSISYWISQKNKGKEPIFTKGTIEKIECEEYIPTNSQYKCSICNKEYKTSGGFSKHRKTCKERNNNLELVNIRETIPIIPEETNNIVNVRDIQNVTVNVQNNINVREFGKENPRWLTSRLLYNVIQDIPRAIPKLFEKKHFNDEFPENKNLKIDTKRSIDKRLQVFEDGRWRVKDSKQTFYKVLLEIHDVLSDALENDMEDIEYSGITMENDTRSQEEQMHINNELRKLYISERFMKKIEKIRPMWLDFKEKIDDQEQRNDLWEDLKTLLLDRQLAIEQGVEI